MINVAINGYGNLGRGAEIAVNAAADMQVVAVFTRRDPAAVQTLGAPVFPISEMAQWVGKVDVCLNCGGSATDLMEQAPAAAALFNTVDSFDTHARVPQHFAQVDATAKESGHAAVISAGWDPGLFSMLRVLGEAVLWQSRATTFWGRGVSQGHSDAIRRIEGVADARQYTVPVPATVAAVRRGEDIELTTRNMHTRECFVVLEDAVANDAATRERVEREIRQMPNYFSDYETSVTFVTAQELATRHAGIPHAGQVIRTGQTSEGVRHKMVFELELDSNPEFTGAVLAAAGRACARKAQRGEHGAFTMFDLTLADLSPVSPQALRAHYL